MKKISILIVLAMILTIGGVYATWNYAQGNVDSVDLNPVVSLTEKVVDTPKGTITVDMSGLDIAIDDANHDYDAELVMTGAVNVTFEATGGRLLLAAEDNSEMNFRVESASYEQTSTPDPLKPYLVRKNTMVNAVYYMTDATSGGQPVNYKFTGAMVMQRTLNTQIPDEDQAIQW